MANLDRPRGLVPLRHVGGGQVRTSIYDIVSAYGTALYQGDPVKMSGTGSTAGRPGIQKAAAGEIAVGVLVGVRFVDNGTGEWSTKAYFPASQAVDKVEALVVDDPLVEFLIQCETGTAFAATMIGNCCDWTDTAGSTSTAQSGAEADISSLATSGNGLRIMGLYEDPENTIAEHADVRVMFAEHQRLGITSGVGGV